MCVRVLIYPQFCYLKTTLIIQKTVQTNEQTKGEREMIHWEVGWHAKLELMSFTHAWEPTNSSSEVVLSNWFYPIMNCEGPADVWDHQCQQLIKNLALQKRFKGTLARLSKRTLHLSLLVASWCNVSKNAGAHWLSNVTGWMCFSSRWVTGPCLLMRLMNQFLVWTKWAGLQEALRHSLTGIIPAKASELKNSVWAPDETGALYLHNNITNQ